MEDTQSPVQEVVSNPLLQRIKMPGETFTLPSGGIFYKEGVLAPGSTSAEIHVHPMTTLDEIVMKTPDLLFSGEAVKQVFSRCIPQVINVDKMLTKDVDFLLACLRKVSYGNEMHVDYDHGCENSKTHTYTIDVNHFIQDAKRIDPTNVSRDFSVEFPNGQKANLQPVIFGEFVRIMQTLNAQDEDASPEKMRDEIVSSVVGMITDVDGIEDKAMIAEWLKNVPPQYITMINDKIDKASGWGANFDVETKCQDCGEDIVISAPMNPLAFFT